MCFRVAFLIFCLLAFVHCETGNNDSRREFGEKKEENLGSNHSAFNDDNRFSNLRGGYNNNDSDHVKTQTSQTSNTRKSEQIAGSVTESSFERRAGESHRRENNYESNFNKNNRVTGTGGQSLGSASLAESSKFSNKKDTARYPSVQNSFARPHGESENVQQFQSRPNNQDGFSSGRPVQESMNYGQQTGFRPIQNGNNFSGRPTGGSSFGPSGGFEPGNEGRPGRPSGGSTLDQSGSLRPGSEEYSSGRPSGGSTLNQSGAVRPGNEGHFSGRPSGSSSSGQSGSLRPGSEEYSSGRPSGGSTLNQSGEVRPGNEGHFSGRPSGSSSSGQSGSLRPGSEEYSSGRPSGGSTLNQTGEVRPGNEGHSSGRPNEGTGFGHSSGLTHEGQTGSAAQRPNSNKEVEHSQAGKTPEGEQNQGTEDSKEDDKDVCFTHLGCFKMGKPWKSTLRPVGAPHAPEKIQTVIHFYSRQNPKQPQNITVYPQVNMGRAQFDPQKISAMIVHGFSNSGNATWMKEMKDVYLRKVDANVMIVDWGKGAQLLNYLQVAGNTRVVGKELGMFVKYLTEHYGADPGRFHLIGHSLGAQICSYLAKDVPGIARLTALDPAQPGFEGFSKEVRLDQTDAEFVDVIHTDARPFIPTLGFGMIAPHGHVDFYMNGGFDQPGCIPPPKKDLPAIKSFLDFAKFPVEVIAKTVACPHARAYEYLIEAFNETDNCIFWGHKTDVKNVFKTVTNTVTQGLFKKFTALSTTCSKDDCIPLGFATKKSPLRGTFVVTTSGRSPYCISEPGVPPETLPQDRKKKSVIEKIKETPILG